jgi:hypothetical protein
MKEYYIEITYIFELLLNVVTARIEALASVNKFLHACVKNFLRL